METGKQQELTDAFEMADTSVDPRPQRLFDMVCVIESLEDPFEYQRRTKWLVTSVVAIAAATSPMGASIFYPAIQDMTKDFHASSTMITLSIALYLLSSSIFPLWWSSFSETMGRRNILFISFALHVVFNLVGGASTNIAMLIVFRLLSGGGAASAQAVGAGVVADLWKPEERGHAMSIFYLGPLIGSTFIALVGGALTDHFGWRSILWFLSAWGAFVLLAILTLLPETSRSAAKSSDPVIASSADTLSGAARPIITSHLRTHFLDPIPIVKQLRFPAIAVVVYNASLAFGTTYILNVSVQAAFSAPPYSFSPTIIGVLFIAYSAGFVVTSVFGGKWMDRIMIKAAAKAERFDSEGNPIYLPEDRLGPNLYLSFALYPATLIWYGWSVQEGISWVSASIATFFFGGAVMLVFAATTTMLTEFTPQRSSIGVALNNFVRNIFACVSTIVAQPLIDAMGHGWLMLMGGLIACSSGLASLWILKWKGSAWRAKTNASQMELHGYF